MKDSRKAKNENEMGSRTVDLKSSNVILILSVSKDARRILSNATSFSLNSRWASSRSERKFACVVS